MIAIQELQGKSRLCRIQDARLLLSTKEYLSKSCDQAEAHLLLFTPELSLYWIVRSLKFHKAKYPQKKVKETNSHFFSFFEFQTTALHGTFLHGLASYYDRKLVQSYSFIFMKKKKKGAKILMCRRCWKFTCICFKTFKQVLILWI